MPSVSSRFPSHLSLFGQLSHQSAFSLSGFHVFSQEMRENVQEKREAGVLDRLCTLKRKKNRARLTVLNLNMLAVTHVSLAALTCTLCHFN